MEKRKVLLDTDIGSDIDDAVCLAYLLCQPACELMGITTVSGEADERAALAGILCHIAGREDIPIYPGCRTPLLTPSRQPVAPQKSVLEKYPHRSAFPEGEYLRFMRDTIRKHPGEISLLAIGPLTNVALLFAFAPDVPGLLKELVLMCGDFSEQDQTYREEWNAVCDPYAARMVYKAALPAHYSVGCNVTQQVTMSREEVKARFHSPLLRAVWDMAEVWFQQRTQIVFHDPLAAVSMFEKTVCRFSRGLVDVCLDESGLGKTNFRPAAEGRHQVAMEVDADAFFKNYFSVTGEE